MRYVQGEDKIPLSWAATVRIIWKILHYIGRKDKTALSWAARGTVEYEGTFPYRKGEKRRQPSHGHWAAIGIEFFKGKFHYNREAIRRQDKTALSWVSIGRVL